MRNVFAALAGLLLLCVCVSAQVGGWDAEVAVYLKTDADQPAVITEQLQREAQALLRPAGVLLRWRTMSDTRLHEDFQAVVVARFEGGCSTSRDSNEAMGLERPAPLATTPVQDGAILPFTRVDCAAVRRLTGMLLSDEPGARRDFLYGRALGRVLTHELYHILGQTKLHTDKGIARPAFHARELLSESFAFNEPAITVLRASAGEAAPATAEAAGR